MVVCGRIEAIDIDRYYLSIYINGRSVECKKCVLICQSNTLYAWSATARNCNALGLRSLDVRERSRGKVNYILTAIFTTCPANQLTVSWSCNCRVQCPLLLITLLTCSQIDVNTLHVKSRFLVKIYHHYEVGCYKDKKKCNSVLFFSFSVSSLKNKYSDFFSAALLHETISDCTVPCFFLVTCGMIFT
jgi:hypothetical protein